MNKQFSIYLDLLRFMAACSVFVSHVPSFAGGWGWQLSGFGHEAVVVFFVLSGFVISYVVYERKETPLKYSVNRLARIYSVAIPALLLTVILYYWGVEFNPNAFIELNKKLQEPVSTFFSALFFVNQSWTASPVFSNLPYWSLGYEVLYYIFFGLVVFTRGYKRIIFLILIVAIMGPSILLYLPIWLAGVLCFKFVSKYQLSIFTSWMAYFLSIIGIILFSFDTFQVTINSFANALIGKRFYLLLLEPAEQFASDYILTVFVVMHLFSSYQLSKKVTVFNESIGRYIQDMSAHTFSLYLYHMPMLYFMSAVVPYQNNPILNLLLAWMAVPLLILVLSRYTENKKNDYKRFFNATLVMILPKKFLI